MSDNSHRNRHHESSYFEHRTQFPDILSAPAPVLRDGDLLIDDETVNLASPSVPQFQPPPPSPAMSSLTSASGGISPPTATATSYDPYASMPSPTAPPPAYNPAYSQSPPPAPTQVPPAVYSHRPPQPSTPQTSQATTPTASLSSFRSSAYSQTPNDDRRPSSTRSSGNYYNNSQDSRDFSNGHADVATMVIPAVPGSTVSHSTRASLSSTRPPEVKRMRQRRKVATVASGVAGGVIGLAVLGPVGAVAGGVGGAMLTKQAGKRMERKQAERIAAARHASEEARYGRAVPALQSESAGLT